MDVKNLTASDFPGIDEAKFNEWKALQGIRIRRSGLPEDALSV
jgi:hypothetical protein